MVFDGLCLCLGTYGNEICFFKNSNNFSTRHAKVPFFSFPVDGAGAQVFIFSCTAQASLVSQISVGLVENALYSFPGEVGIFSVTRLPQPQNTTPVGNCDAQ